MPLSLNPMRVEEGSLFGGRSGAYKRFLEGTHRLISPEETISRIAHLMPVMGITRVANVTGLDTIGIPVVMVCRPNSRSISVSQGKGFDIASAKASGLMESVESYHAERISLPLKLGSYEDLRYTHPVVDFDKLPRFSDNLFTPYTQLLWIEGWDILSDDPVWVPYELVHLNYTLPLPTGHGCFVPSSNGLASGNHKLEAISHGICEVVERDSLTLWHLLPSETQERTHIDLDSVDDPRCRIILEKYHNAGVLVAVWEITSDVGIPAFLCRILQANGPRSHTLRPAAGMGCHPSREVALLRALTEAAQSRLTFISGARDDMPRDEYERFLDPQTLKKWRHILEERVGLRNFCEAPTWQAETFEDDVGRELEQLEIVGIEQVIIVDLTKTEFRIPVVRVIIPGLEGIDHSPKCVPGPRARARLPAAT